MSKSRDTTSKLGGFLAGVKASTAAVAKPKRRDEPQQEPKELPALRPGEQAKRFREVQPPPQIGPSRSTPSQLGVRLPAELLARARAAVYWTPGLTITSLVEIALLHELERPERGRGEEFSLARGEIKGRPQPRGYWPSFGSKGDSLATYC